MSRKRNPPPPRKRLILTINRLYVIKRYGKREDMVLRFIRVTPKGFNFLVEGTGRTFFRSPIYSAGYAKEDIPSAQETFVIWTPAQLQICDKESGNELKAVYGMSKKNLENWNEQRAKGDKSNSAKK